MRAPGLFAVDEIDDELGEGIRLHTDTDHLYELRTNSSLMGAEDVTASRIYSRDGDSWKAKTQIPGAEDRDAYEQLKEVRDRITDAYDVDVTLPAYDFQEGDRRFDFDGGIDGVLIYNTPEDVDDDIYVIEQPDRLLETMAGYSAAGASTGATWGAMASPEPLSGAVIGGGLGSVAGLAGLLDAMIHDCEDVETPAPKAAKWAAKTSEYLKGHTPAKGGPLQDSSFIDDLNTKRSLEGENIEEVEDYDLAEQYRELESRDLDGRLRSLLEDHFGSFEDRPGVIVTVDVDTYADARAFVSHMHDEEPVDVDRPSVYDSPGTFDQLFRHLDEEEKKDWIEEVLDEDHERIQTFLEEEYGDLVTEVGQERF